MRKSMMFAAPLVVVAALLVMAGGASAKDRNRDRIPDRWEKKFKLSLAVNQARRDQDRDRVDNLDEFRHGMDPRDRDSDDDGIRDGDENAGTIASFDGATLIISLARGGQVSGQVTAGTRIRCRSEDRASTSRDGGSGGDNSGPGSGNEGPGNAGETCTTADLIPGTPVHEAELEGTVFEKVDLIK